MLPTANLPSSFKEVNYASSTQEKEEEGEITMPATSENQRKLFCIALSMKRGETPKSYSAQAAKMCDQMSEEQLKEYCESPVKK